MADITNLKIKRAVSLFLVAFVAAVASGKTIYVDDDANGLNDGSSWLNAYKYLQDAFMMAADGDELRVAQGVYKPDQFALSDRPNLGRSETFQLKNGVVIRGGYAGGGQPDPDARDIALHQTILSGDIGIPSDKSDNCYHIFYHPEGLNLDNTAILDGFTITGGNANGDSWPHSSGGGMFNYKSSPTVINCTFSGNLASRGGGMFNHRSSPTVTNCTFSGNKTEGQGAYGGGMFNYYYSSPTVNGCTFSNNSATWGGGMLNDKSSPMVKDCTFTANAAYWGDGGGMCNDSSSPTVESCTFTANSAKYNGGGMVNYNSSPAVEGCTFTNNSANGGGGMYNDYYSSPTVTDCTFTANSAYYRGGGMDNRLSSPTVEGCTFSGNSAEAGGGMCNYNESSPTVKGCTFSANSAEVGGGMDNRLSSPTVEGCTFSGNSAEVGGGMGNDDSSPTVKGCTFSANSAEVGGGMDNYSSSPTVTDCNFSGNSAAAGGGMYNDYYSSPTVEDCTFSGNSAESHGGGMDNRLSSPTVEGCTFSSNSASSGGGMRNYYGSMPTVKACTFIGNSADAGGGMFNEDNSSPTVNNCTFTDNNAPNGPAMACDSYWQSHPSTVTIVNSIVWNGLEWLWNNDRSTITITYSDVQGGWIGTGNINADPCFADAGHWDPNGLWVDGDYHLQIRSSCINAGDPNYVPEPNETDLDGKPRVIGGRIDMGAYEFFAAPREVPMKFTPQALNCNSKGKWIKAHFVLPAEFTIGDVDTNSPAKVEPLGIESEYMNVFVNEDDLVEVEAAFDRAAFCDAITGCGAVEVTVVGLLTNGQYFYGTDTIKIIKSSFECLAILSSHWLEANCGKPDWCNRFDINRDLVVNLKDFALMASHWLEDYSD